MTTAALVSAEDRKSILARAIQSQIRPGMFIESQSDFQAVLVFKQSPPSALIFVLGVFTLGLLWLVWILMPKRDFRRVLYVDEYGRLTYQDIK